MSCDAGIAGVEDYRYRNDWTYGIQNWRQDGFYDKEG